jgi:hypothetical protein
MTIYDNQNNPREFTENPDSPKFAKSLVFGLAGFSLAIHLITIAITAYSIHRDEFLYLAMGKYLQLWRMDFPPAIAVLANIARFIFGDNLFAIRLFPALAGAALVIMAGLIASELGGKRLAQALAGFAVMLNPLFLRTAALFQPVVFDQLWWTIGLYLLIRFAKTQKTYWWILIGIACGLGLLTKFSILLFGFGLFVGLIISPQRKILLTRWPYYAMGIALVIGGPSLIGQIRLGFPVFNQLGNLYEIQLTRVTPFAFLSGQFLMLGPAIILAIVGTIYLLGQKTTRPVRTIGWTCLALFVTLIVLQGKPYYIGPIYPTLLAAGAVALTTGAWRFRRLALVITFVLIAIYDLAALPLGLPILPPSSMARYAAKIGMTKATTTNTGRILPLPQDYADMLGWEDQVAAVARAYNSLPPEKQAEAVILASNYGEAAAIDFFGPRYNLPRAICVLGSYWFFGPGDKPGNVVIAFGYTAEQLSRFYNSITEIEIIDNAWGVPEERNNPVIVGEQPKQTLQELWPSFRGIN